MGGVLSSKEEQRGACKIDIILDQIPGRDFANISLVELKALWKKYDHTLGANTSKPRPITQAEARNLFNDILSLSRQAMSGARHRLGSWFKVNTLHLQGWPKRYVLLDRNQKELKLMLGPKDPKPARVLSLRRGATIQLTESRLTVSGPSDRFEMAPLSHAQEELQLWYVNLHYLLREAEAEQQQQQPDELGQRDLFKEQAIMSRYMEVLRRDNVLRFGFDTIEFAEVAFQMMNDEDVGQDSAHLEWEELFDVPRDPESFRAEVPPLAVRVPAGGRCGCGSTLTSSRCLTSLG